MLSVLSVYPNSIGLRQLFTALLATIPDHHKIVDPTTLKVVSSFAWVHIVSRGSEFEFVDN